MVERKSGPVKPPILDMAARKAAASETSEKPTAQTSKKASATSAPPNTEKQRPDNTASKKDTNQPKATTERRTPAWPLLAATLLGSIGGAALAFGIAASGYWPTSAPDMAINPNRINTLETQLEEITNTNAQTSSAIETLTQQIAATEARTPEESANPQAIEDLRSQITTLGTELSAIEPIDTTQITSQIDAIETQLSALAAGASSDDAEAFATNLSETRDNLTDLTTRLSDLETTMAAQTEATNTLATQLQDFVDTNAAQPAPASNLNAQLPLALSGLEAAIVTGRPYAAELNALQTALPEISAPQSIIDAATTGLPTAQDISGALNEAIPAMLLARPATSDANWQDNLRDRFTALLALRPTGDVTGNTPEAIISRLENAINQRDFISADSAFQTLPGDMQAAAGTLANDLTLLAEAEKFAQAARAAALKPQTTPNSEAAS